MGTLRSGDAFASPLPATLSQRPLYLTNNLHRKSEDGELVLSVRSTPARGQATRARRLVALAAFESSFHVEFVDLNWAFKL
jgi:hypothetical protein